MRRAIKLITELSAEEIYRVAKQERNGRQRGKLLGIAGCLEGRPRADCAKIAGLTESAFRTWVKRFNEGGYKALEAKKTPGRPGS